MSFGWTAESAQQTVDVHDQLTDQQYNKTEFVFVSVLGNNGARIRADAGFSFLVLLALLITSQHILV